MTVKLVYRCRYNGCTEEREADMPPGRMGVAFRDAYLAHTVEQRIVHACTESGSHLGLCDLVGAVVSEGGTDGSASEV